MQRRDSRTHVLGKSCFWSSQTLRAQRLKIFKIALRDWKFQARLKISSEPPTKPLFVLGNSEASGLNFSCEIEACKRDWKLQARLNFLNLWALRVQGRTNPFFSKPCLCPSDTRHFRRFRGADRGFAKGRFPKGWFWRMFPDPRRQKPQFQDRPPGLKFSSEVENFKRAAHQTPILGKSEAPDWSFQARLKFSSEIDYFKRGLFFSIFGPLGNAVVLNAVVHRNTQKSANARKCKSAKERKRKSAKERKRAQKGTKECKRALPRKICKQPSAGH